MIDIQDYSRRFIEVLLAEFDERVCYIGLQGSYLRGEANQGSDIDMMVILNEMTVTDMERYRSILDRVGNADLACGFICSKADMQKWNPLEICQLKYATKDLYGVLADFLPKWTLDDEVNYVKMSLNNLYHGLCHSYIHGSRERLAQGLYDCYKAAFFILQNTYYLATCREGAENAEFVLQKAELVKRLQGEDRAVIETLLDLTNGGHIDVERHYALLFNWCQHKMAAIR